MLTSRLLTNLIKGYLITWWFGLTFIDDYYFFNLLYLLIGIVSLIVLIIFHFKNFNTKLNS